MVTEHEVWTFIKDRVKQAIGQVQHYNIICSLKVLSYFLVLHLGHVARFVGDYTINLERKSVRK